MLTYNTLENFISKVNSSAYSYAEETYVTPTHIFISPLLWQELKTEFRIDNPYHYGEPAYVRTAIGNLQIEVVNYWEEIIFIVGVADELNVVERYILKDG